MTMFTGSCNGDSKHVGRLEASIVEKVYGPWLGDKVEGENAGGKESETDDVGEILVERTKQVG